MENENDSGVYTDQMKTAILEVGRELFARYGYKKTTMEDIAQGLNKGKSSLYYYFKNKEEIFQAVVDWEVDILFKKLVAIVKSSISPDEKLKKYVKVRMETIRELENYHQAMKDDTVKGGFDFLDHIKGKSEKDEVEMIRTMLDEGVSKDIFQVKNIPIAAVAISTALKGLEVPLFRSMNLKSFDDFKTQINNILNILFFGLMKQSKEH